VDSDAPQAHNAAERAIARREIGGITTMSDTIREPSRRSLIAGAGAAVAAGVAAAAAAPADNALGEMVRSGVAVGPAGGTVAEFRGRIAQTGSSGGHFSAIGFLTRLRGAHSSDLFAGTTTSVHTALFTLVAKGALTARVLDQSVHALDIAGKLTVYQRRRPGAHFNAPGSFTVGRAVASFAMTLQDVLAVFAPASGIPTLTGDMRQNAARELRGGLTDNRFGRLDQRLRMYATGLGMLTDPVTLNAELEIAGNWAAT
jgi:hypothetical protein